MYFDTHCHLNSEKLYNDYRTYIQKALDANVTKMCVVGFDLPSSKLAVELASQYDCLYAAVGFCPTDVKETTDEDLEELEKLVTCPKVVAVGETGLDYYWDQSYNDHQKYVFRRHMDLAKKYNLPVIIHCRDAYEDTYNILKEYDHYGIMHCYSGSSEMAERFIKLNYYISLAGPVTFKNAKVPKKVAREISLDHLLIETDSPYMAPTPHRGKTNEPSFVINVAKEIANQKGISEEEVANATYQNALKLFRIEGL